ncbi:MAG: hypothetical protein CM15mP83_4890 [Flavobacteriaceae bacterium]|nr:MAG: hypothetical protein CM15mP83_4890 [Flavobacteriaceae bacterium]
MGFGLDSDAIHSPNEHFGFITFKRDRDNSALLQTLHDDAPSKSIRNKSAEIPSAKNAPLRVVFSMFSICNNPSSINRLACSSDAADNAVPNSFHCL